jgi:hypothetical protein
MTCTHNGKLLTDILAEHQQWLNNDGGKRANLSKANLCGADLRLVNLCGADLCGDFMREADLRGANLFGADLSAANLCSAKLSKAFLFGADLNGTLLHGAELPDFQIPDGDIVGWKKCGSFIVRLRIPYRARRTACLVTRKCRAELAVVDWIEGDAKQVICAHGGIYRLGEEIWPDSYCDDFRIDCSHGIHFFLTREEAEVYKV